jgi:fused signal recognition particle receptor
MSFFKKLKDKLFRSSSKIEEGLDAIVEDGGEIEEVAPEALIEGPTEADVEAERAAAEAAAAQEAEAERLRVEAEAKAAEDARLAAEAAAAEQARVEAEAQAAAEAAAAAEQARVEAEAKAAEEDRLRAEEAARLAQEAEAARLKAEAEAEERAAAEAERARAAQAEQDRLAAEEEAARAEEERLAAEAAQAAEADRARVEEERAQAEAERSRLTEERAAQEKLEADRAEAARAEAERVAAEQAEAARVEQERLDAAQQAEKAEAARRTEAERQAAERQAQAEAQAAEAARVAEAQAHEAAAAAALEAEEAAAEETPSEPVSMPLTKLEPTALEQAAAEEGPVEKKGLLGRIFGRGEKKTVIRRELDDDMLEQLEELLITADMGVDTALRVTANMAEGRLGKKLSVQEIKELMSTEIARIMEPVAKPMPLFPNTPQVVLVVGVNGSGKTTTIGKLASQFKAAGKSVVIAAGDTFRAAAVEQLQVWGDRAGVPVLTAPEGSDPASLAFDAMEKAEADGADLLMIDTAGRLQNRADLMEELAKIVRVIRKKDPSAPHNTLLVLDATTGQNALSQVKIFQEISDVSGLVMTKLDGTAKGGVLVALADKFGLPIHAIGVGEQIDDLDAFDPQDFADALTGLERG